MSAPFNALKKGFATLRDSEELSDCQLICGPYHFNLHKVVLASHSDYFRIAFKTGTFKEGESGTIGLKAIESDTDDADDACDEAEIVKLMVDYFYSFDYLPDADERLIRAIPHARVALKELVDMFIKPKESEEAGSTVDESGTGTTHNQPPNLQDFIVEHAKIFAMAVKYQIEGLRHLAVQKFEREMNKYNVHNHDNFAHAVSIIFTSTPEDIKDLRILVEDLLYTHFEDLKHKDGFEDAMCSLPHLTYSLLKRKSEKPSPTSTETPSNKKIGGICQQRPVDAGVLGPDVCTACYNLMFR